MIYVVSTNKTPKTIYDFAQPSSPLIHSIYDISLFWDIILSQNEINDILNRVWTPEINYSFPVTPNTSGKDKEVENLKRQYSRLMLFPWLLYSVIQDGALCKFYLTFSKSHDGLNSQVLGSLVINVIPNWKHEVETFTKHSFLNITKNVFLKPPSNLLNILKYPCTSIKQQLDTYQKSQTNCRK